MANRTGTYIAFDGLGETDPTKSDFRYYATILAWCANSNIEFNITNSHEKTYAVRDSSLKATLYARIQERLRASKICLLFSQRIHVILEVCFLTKSSKQLTITKFH